MTEDELMVAVERAFAITSRDLPDWPDPNPERRPADDAYSRVTDAARYRIVGARADAWAAAAVELGLARIVDRVDWAEAPGTKVSRSVMVVPEAIGGLPMVIARSALGDCDDAGLTLGAGRPATQVVFVPDCGCDACDSGSQDLIDLVDEYVRAIVTGRFRRLSRGQQVITVTGESSSSANVDRRRSAAALADPRGWTDLRGTSWLSA